MELSANELETLETVGFEELIEEVGIHIPISAYLHESLFEIEEVDGREVLIEQLIEVTDFNIVKQSAWNLR